MNKNLKQVLKAGEKTRFKHGHSFVGKKENLNFKKGMIPWNKKPDAIITCVQCGKQKKIKPAFLNRQKCCSKVCADKYKDSGKTSEARKIRVSKQYKLWREAVFKRDSFVCIWCGQNGGNLNADHIKSFADFPELRFAIDNGRTLCVTCHRTTENFGNKGRVKKESVASA